MPEGVFLKTEIACRVGKCEAASRPDLAHEAVGKTAQMSQLK